MRDFQRRNKLRKGLYSWINFILLVVILAVILDGVFNVYKKNRMAKKDVDQIKMVESELLDRKEKLESDIARLQTDAGIDEEIRNKFRLVKAGEEMVIVINETTTKSTSTEQNSWWNKMKKIIDF